MCDPGVSDPGRVGADAANLVFGLSPKEPVDYVELVLFEGREQGRTLMAAGKKCASAKDWRSCEGEVARAVPPEGQLGFMHGCIPGACAHGVVATRGDDVSVHATPEHVVRFLAPIDTSSEALLVAFANGYSPGGEYYAKCDLVKGKGLTKVAGGGARRCTGAGQRPKARRPHRPAPTGDCGGARGEARERRHARAERGRLERLELAIGTAPGPARARE